jgi:hypothetical protein
VKISKTNALSMKPIKIGGFDDGIAQTGEIAITLVIGHDQNDVGTICFITFTI